MKKRMLCSAAAMAAAATVALDPAPAVAQVDRSFQLEEIVVTARRREERLQDVPISMTVLGQQQIDNANITNAVDIALYTPSLQANNRFGADSSNFAIRGFSQELRTTSSVGVYFAEVIAPRGANTTQSGDGAGPGDFFDLENVQVLYGPQGTLFGRNTTGGAVLLTPKKPTDEFEGYLEGSAGNFDMRRLQGVVNIPVGDRVRVRLGVDHQERDGYLDNISGIGPDDFADLDYTSYRASVVWDITDNLENYTIAKYTDSSNNGAPYTVFACHPDVTLAFSGFCHGDLNSRTSRGEYDVYNFMPDSSSELEQWQVINTTTLQVSDNLTVKNILSYAELETRQNMALFGTNWRASHMAPGLADQNIIFQMVGSRGIPTTDQKTFVEEFQLQGSAFDDSLTWQAGLYYEKSKPAGTYGSLNPSQLSCDMDTLRLGSPADWRCNDIMAGLAMAGAYEQLYPLLLQGMMTPEAFAAALAQVPPYVGSGVRNAGGVTYENQAVYLQGTWEFSPRWSATAGLRYTKDETWGRTRETIYFFPNDIFGGYFAPDFHAEYVRTPKVTSEEPTWLLGVEYKPTADVMLYGKYARGYRQGSVNLASIQEWETHGPEQVDTFEMGAKTSFHGRFPGTFNIAAFYNDFKDQQIQVGYFTTTGVGNTSILNAGASTIWGVEIESSLWLTDNLNLAASYSYLDTEVDELELPDESSLPASIAVYAGTTAVEGEPLPYSPKHNLVLNASYRLPVDERMGDLTAVLTYIYTDEQQAVARSTSALAVLPSYEIVNASFNWQRIAGSAVDMSVFVTNLTDEKYRTNVAGNWTSGIEVGRVGVPRMYGMRLRYNF